MTDLVPVESESLDLVDHLEHELERVATVAEAENLWRQLTAASHALRVMRVTDLERERYAKLKLRAEHRYGELLGERKRGRPTGHKRDSVSLLAPREKKEQQRARKVAKVPIDTLEKFLGDAEDPDSITRAGLLKTAKGEARDERNAQTNSVKPLPPVGLYSLIYADPPWRYEYAASDSRKIENQYPTMTIDDLCDAAWIAENVPAADDCVLYLWATSPKLAESLRLMDAWGFSYRTCMVWVKDRIGMGYYARQRHELLLIGRRGDMSPPSEQTRPDSVIEAPRGQHSAKPERVYELLEQMYPGIAKHEMFSRSPREGWSSWGNQAT